jgi:hypothetical protein
MTKRKKNILKILFAFIYCPLAAEVMVRALDPVPMLPRYVCATYYGIRGNEPNKTYWHRSAECKVQVRTNSKGIRSDYEISYSKPEGTKRIVLLGDSFGMGYEVDLPDTFTARMVYYLEAKYHIKNVEVVNLSTSGHGNAEELIVLQNEGLKYNPDLVLLAWHSTDYDDNFRSDLYELKNGQLKGKAEHYLPGVDLNRKLYRIPLYPWIADNSQLYNMIRDWAGITVKAWLVAARSSSKKKVQQDENLSDYKHQLVVALLDKIKYVSTKAGAEFVILDIPRCKSRTKFVSQFPHEEAAKTKSFQMVSPIAKFAEAKGQKVYWERGHGHWTPLGCDMVGETLADYIYENKLLE